MAIVSVRATGGRLSAYGKQQIALSMYVKGKSYVGAALLVRREVANEYVVLHLLCLGLEVTLKGLLLLADYNMFKPRLRNYGRNGHDLELLVTDAVSVFGLKPPPTGVSSQLGQLSAYYSQHLLRYGGIQDIFIAPESIGSDLVLRRLAAAIRLTERILACNRESEAHCCGSVGN